MCNHADFPETPSVHQADLKCTEIHLHLKDTHHHHLAMCMILMKELENLGKETEEELSKWRGYILYSWIGKLGIVKR